jgi:hypothetical protein
MLDSTCSPNRCTNLSLTQCSAHENWQQNISVVDCCLLHTHDKRVEKRTWTRLVKAASACLMVVGEDSAGLRASLMSGSRIDRSVMFSGAEAPPVLRGCPGCPMMLGTRSASQQDDMYLRAYWTAQYQEYQLSNTCQQLANKGHSFQGGTVTAEQDFGVLQC